MPSGTMNLIIGFMNLYFEESEGLRYQINTYFHPTFSAENLDLHIAIIQKRTD